MSHSLPEQHGAGEQDQRLSLPMALIIYAGITNLNCGRFVPSPSGVVGILRWRAAFVNSSAGTQHLASTNSHSVQEIASYALTPLRLLVVGMV